MKNCNNIWTTFISIITKTAKTTERPKIGTIHKVKGAKGTFVKEMVLNKIEIGYYFPTFSIFFFIYSQKQKY